MPILVDAPPADQSAEATRIIRIPGLPDFNSSDATFKVTGFDGWFSTGGREVQTVARGDGPGSRFARAPRRTAKFPTLTGRIFGTPDELAYWRQQLFAAFPDDTDTPIDVLGVGADLRGWFRLYDEADISTNGHFLWFALPLIQPDPYKYSPASGASSFGVFSGGGFYRLYDTAGSDRTYDVAGSYRTYQSEEEQSGLPDRATVVNAGDVDSDRFVVTVAGPLEADDYELLNETTGQRLSANITLIPGQELAFDMHNRRATLGGVVVSEFVTGDWLRLVPGANVLRLFSGTINAAASATVTDIFSAYQ